MNATSEMRSGAEQVLRAMAVIVLYKMAPEESPAVRSFLAARSELGGGHIGIPVILWDNSPTAKPPQHLSDCVEYLSDGTNSGLAGAYNAAIRMAIRNELQWLITLDQDTQVPRDYLVRMVEAALECENLSGVGAIVPQIATGPKRLSPYRLVVGAVPQWLPAGYRGIPDDPVFAFNSGAMVSIAALRQVGGYDLRFPIDCSDHALFHDLRRHGKRIYVDGGIQLDHEFSMIDMNRRMTPERYRAALMAESAFWDLHMSRFARCERNLRLLARLARQLIREDSPELLRVTRECLHWRLFHSRRERIERWDAHVRQSSTGSARQRSGLFRASGARPRVSVCMAAFNGGRFVEEQLRSILAQLEKEDEIVIVDDCSTDHTLERIRSIIDPRIRLFSHARNEGLVAAFEDALRGATGEILFLCDDDDVWAPTKVERMLGEFRDWPEAQVAISKAILIDERGVQQPDSRMNRFGRFKPGFWRNVFRNHYQGSAMAIRASLLGQVLPFPRNKSFLHDVWIGTRNEAAGGKTVFIDEPLVYYRRHSQNVSRVHPWRVKIRLRMELLMAHAASAFRFKTSTPVVMESGEVRSQASISRGQHSWSK